MGKSQAPVGLPKEEELKRYRTHLLNTRGGNDPALWAFDRAVKSRNVHRLHVIMSRFPLPASALPTPASKSQPTTPKKRCLVCDGPTLPSEDYCASCIGS